MLLWNARQVFTWTVLCLKKKKKKSLFPLLFDVSKYKKSQDSYTNNLQ